LIAFGAINGGPDRACVLNAYALKKWEDPCWKLEETSIEAGAEDESHPHISLF